MVPKPLPCSQTCSAQRPDELEDLVGPGVGGEVEVGVGVGDAEEGVAHRPADQVEAVAFAGERRARS